MTCGRSHRIADTITTSDLDLVAAAVDTIRSPLQSVIYHYTDLDGLIGIFERRELWAHHNQFMNDPDEFRYTYRLAHEWMKANYPIDVQTEQERLRAFLDAPFHGSPGQDFLACFSNRRDDLSQWCAYAANGEGYSIGFAVDSLIHCAEPQGSLPIAVPVIYELAEQQTILDRVLRPICEAVDTNLRTPETEAVRLQRRLNAVLFLLGIQFKHRSFAAEDEVRLICGDEGSSRFRFRRGRRGLTPYLPLVLPLDEHPEIVPSITIGPAHDRKAATLALRLLLRKQGLEDKVEILVSEAPHR
jgi:hypothetical protein